jgi:hypothetical protein
MSKSQKHLNRLAGELEKREIAYVQVADSAGPEVAVSWRHFRLMVAWEPAYKGYDWQLLNEDGQVCTGTWREESVKQVADIIQAMVKEICSFDKEDTHLHAVLISAGIPAIYEHTGGGCHNVEVRLTEECYVIFGTDYGDRPVGWELMGPEFEPLVGNKESTTPEEIAPYIKHLVAFFALGS